MTRWLKGLITSKHQMIEAKGIDPIRIDNYVRLMMTSNEDWVVPAGKDERRFCVLDVGEGAAQNHGYFAEMMEELDNGGRARLLHDLLTFDLDSVDIWQIPRTAGLLEQKIRSLARVDKNIQETLANINTGIVVACLAVRGGDNLVLHSGHYETPIHLFRAQSLPGLIKLAPAL